MNSFRSKSLFISLLVLFGTTLLAQDQSLEGDWHGRLQVQPGFSLRLVFHLKADATWTGTLDSPDQGAKDIPLSSVQVKGDSLRLAASQLGLSYEGVLRGDTIAGTFRQGMGSFSLTLARHEIAAPKRPQEPSRPYPYEEKQLSIENAAAQIRLSATLTQPTTTTAGQKRPAIVLITGSGPQDRDESLMGHKPFLLLSDALTRAGFMTLRADDRGVGESEGDFGTATSYDLASDVKAQIDYLAGRSDVAEGIILLGHSEGGLLAMLNAYDDKRVSDLILVAAPAMKGEKIIVQQAKDLHRAQSGMEMPAEQQQFYRELYQIAANKQLSNAEAREELGQLFDQNSSSFVPQHLSTIEKEKLREVLLEGCLSPWMRTYLSIPIPMKTRAQLRHYRVLALYGSKDLQVSPWSNAPRMIELLEIDRGAERGDKVLVLDGLNHLMQTAQSGLPAEYAQISETFSPKALQAIIDFLAERLKN